MSRLIRTVILGLAGLLVFAAPAAAQDGPSMQQQNPSGTTEEEPGSTDQGPPTRSQSGRPPSRPSMGRPGNRQAPPIPKKAESDEEAWSATVRVVDGLSGDPIAGAGVELKASRPRGPFEPREPKPAQTWTSQANQQGRATFEMLPDAVSQRGLQVYATTRENGLEFKSARQTPGDGIELTIEVYPQADDASSVRIKRLRTVVEPWEDFLVFTQFWQLTVDGNMAVDTSALSGEEYEKGLPLQLPHDAKGIHAFGPGETETVESTVHWRGVLRPGETVSLRARFSISASSSTFVFRHSVDYPADEVQMVLPLVSDHDKVGRLSDASMAAKGFDKVEATRDVPGFRRDKDYLFARGKSLEAGDSYAVKLTGMPLERPVGPWVATGLGLLGILLVLAFAGRESVQLDDDETQSVAVETLQQEREELLDELADLEEAWEEGDISEVTYETESLRLRERLSLVMRKLDELTDND
jgi:hypothetical protein